jgi:hypothetical protein
LFGNSFHGAAEYGSRRWPMPFAVPRMASAAFGAVVTVTRVANKATTSEKLTDNGMRG